MPKVGYGMVPAGIVYHAARMAFVSHTLRNTTILIGDACHVRCQREHATAFNFGREAYCAGSGLGPFSLAKGSGLLSVNEVEEQEGAGDFPFPPTKLIAIISSTPIVAYQACTQLPTDCFLHFPSN